MYKRRLTVFLALCLAVIGAVSWLRPPARSDATTSEEFWSAKTHDGDAAYDIVVAGDSRTLMGVAPVAMREYFPGAAILNFGYLGAGLTPEFVAAAARKLDPGSDVRMLVVGVTPFSLISSSLRNKHFNEESSKPAIVRDGWLDLGPVRRAFEPFRPFAEARSARPAVLTSFRDGGWMASDGTLRSEVALRAYAGLYARSEFDAANFARLVEALAEMRANGVRVLAFRHPSTAEMEELENRVSGFREAHVCERFADAGVTWLSFASPDGRPLEFASTDGSHLRQSGALVFSAELGRQLATHR